MSDFPTSLYPGLSLPVPVVRRREFLRAAGAEPLPERLRRWRAERAGTPQRRRGEPKAAGIGGKGGAK
jgi:hypothetical protein